MESVITKSAIEAIAADLSKSSFCGESQVARIFVEKDGTWGAEVSHSSQATTWSMDWAYWVTIPLGTGVDALAECGEGVEYAPYMEAALNKVIQDLEGMDILHVDSADLHSSYHQTLQGAY